MTFTTPTINEFLLPDFKKAMEALSVRPIQYYDWTGPGYPCISGEILLEGCWWKFCEFVEGPASPITRRRDLHRYFVTKEPFESCIWMADTLAVGHASPRLTWRDTGEHLIEFYWSSPDVQPHEHADRWKDLTPKGNEQ